MIPTIDDSTHSVASTFTVEVPIKECVSLSSKAQSPSRKVRFNECRNQYFASTERAAEDCRETWYTAKDYKQFRSNVRRVSNGENDDAKYSFSNAMEEIYEAVCAVDFIIDDATDLFTPELERKLVQLFKSSDNCLDFLGLEYKIVVPVRKDRKNRRENLQDVVREIQTECDCGLWSEEEVDNELRDSCLKFSQTACLFSQLLAKAQLAA
jgi:hypothetical protein